MRNDNKVLKALKSFFEPYATDEYKESFESEKEWEENVEWILLTTVQCACVFVAILSTYLVFADIFQNITVSPFDVVVGLICSMIGIVVSVIKREKFENPEEDT